MSLSPEKFKSKNHLDKIKIAIRTLPPEKSFYFYFSTLLAALVLVVILIIYVRNNYTDLNPSYRQKLNIHMEESVQNVIPLFTKDRSEKLISRMLFAGLIKDEGVTYSPDLAESLSYSADGLLIDIKLKESTKFSDGSPITPEDIIFTYNLIQSFDIDSEDRAKYEGLSIEKIDDRSIRVKLKKSYSQVNKLLTLGVISKKFYEGDQITDLESSAKNLDPVTSGQYKISSVTFSDSDLVHLTLKNNDEYYKLSNFAYIDFDFYDNYKNQEEYSKYILDNNIDISISPNHSRPGDGYVQEVFNSRIYAALFFNGSKNEILSKKDVRGLIYQNINRENIVSSIIKTGATPAHDIYSDLIPLAANNIKKASDIAQYNTPLSTTTTLRLTYLNTDKNNKIYESLKQSLLAINIELLENPATQEELSTIIKNREFELLLTSLYVEDVTSLYSFLHSSQKNAPGLNITNYVSKDVDKNIEMLRTSQDEASWREALNALREEYYDEYPFVTIYNKISNVNSNKNITIERSDQKNKGEENILISISSAYKDQELRYKFLNKYQNIIIKVNKILH